ncbi:hypothetical protein [Novosphingobium sp. PY1]|nr:hypothetical protein [Novosphingobium sp. PY1]
MGFEAGNDRKSGRASRFACSAPDDMEGESEHDARGLVLAIALCMACWAALGYFLLG